MTLPSPSGGAQYGRWKLLRRIGGGGNGDVWLAACEGEQAAIKFLTKVRPIPYARFRAEVEVMSSCNVPGVVPILDRSLPDALGESRPWYAMPVGRPLVEQLASVNLRGIVAAIAEVADTVAELHAADIVHRDIKPGNLLWLDGRAAIGDFGLVDYPGKEDLTGVREEIGPRWTMAPEVRRGGASADPKPADVYSLAKTLWILITRDEKGFEGQYSASTSVSLERFSRGRFITPVESVLAHATEHVLASRPTMAEFARELREWLRIDEAFHERNALEWAEAQKRLFPIVAPARATWGDLDQIVAVLGVAATRTNMNHMFMPNGGGLDLHRAVRSTREPGCIELTADGLTYVLRPARLIFESFREDTQWNYFRLEAAPLEPSGVYENDPDETYEEVADVGGELYADRRCWDENWFGGDSLPENSRAVTRFYSGSVVIFQKASLYNQLRGQFDAYDARHDKMSADAFRVFVARMAAKAAEVKNGPA